MKPLKIDIRSSATRRVPMSNPQRMCFVPKLTPEQGDVVVGKIAHMGQHDRIEIIGGREVILRPGLLCALVLGRRYSTLEFHGEVPQDLPLGATFHLLNVGGTSGTVVGKNQLAKDPTILQFMGYASTQSGLKQNIKHHVFRPNRGKTLPTVILVTGSDMDVGKTVSAGWAIRGLVRAGHKTSGVKLTGTTRMKDLYAMADAGADPILDFVDFGLPSTFGASDKILAQMFNKMSVASAESKCEFMVAEVGDSIFQPESFRILGNRSIMDHVALLVFAAADSVAAYGGYFFLKKLGHPPDLLAGLFTTSSFRIQEVKSQFSVPTLSSNSEHQAQFVELARQAHQKQRDDFTVATRAQMTERIRVKPTDSRISLTT